MPDNLTDTKDPDSQQLTSEAELALAFSSDADQKQEGGSDKQEGDPSRLTDGTTDPSRADVSKTKEEILASLTLDELTAHPTLGPALKSFADKEAARQLSGKTKILEQQLRAQISTEQAREYFASLTQEELAEELSKNPEAAEVYGRLKAAAPPPIKDPEALATVQYYTRVIRDTSQRMKGAGLSEKVLADLDPEKFLSQGGDSEEILASWIDAVDSAIITAKVTAEVEKRTKEKESDDLDKSGDGVDKGGAITEAGRKTSPLPDINTRSDLLLADAFERVTASKRR